MIEGGPSGTVNLVTRKPLDTTRSEARRQRSGSIMATCVKNGPPEFSVLGSNTFETGRRLVRHSGVLCLLRTQEPHRRIPGG